MASMKGTSPIEATELQDSDSAAADVLMDTGNRRLRQDATGAYKNYHRWLRLKRLALAAFVTMSALFFLWAVPWLPRGLDTGDYTVELAFTTYLLFGVTFTAALAMIAQELTRRRRESLVAWTSVYDEATGLKNRAYLYDRLSIECERAKRNSSAFSIFVLRIPIRETGLPPQTAADAIERVTRRSVLVALLSGSDVAILSLGVSKKECDLLLEQLRSVIANELSDLSNSSAIHEIRGGSATYGVDGTEPESLVQAARSTVSRRSDTDTRSA